MKVILRSGRLVLVPQTDEERLEVAAWKAEFGGHVLYAQPTAGEGVALFDLGAKEEACNEPINVTSRSPHPAAALISNFAHSPFALDGREYASVEGFWQGLKFERDGDRRRVAALWGGAALKAGGEVQYGATVRYEGELVAVGTRSHWDLMERACRAKFTQDDAAREALLSTGARPLTHRVRRDSRSIPGVIMADIWIRLRAALAPREAGALAGGEDG